MSYEVRGAVEVKPARPQDPQALDQQQISQLRKHFGWLNKQWIAVSFVHMSITMLLFSGNTTGLVWLVTVGAIQVMVLGIDLALLWLSAYIEAQRRFKQPVGFFHWSAFVVALGLEFGFNTAALWSHRPPPDVFPSGASKLLSVVFGAFVALIIYVSATSQSKLDRTRLAIDDFYAEQRRQADQQRQRDEDARRKREEDEEYRRRRREEQERNRRLESHNETKSLPEPVALGRIGNGKARIPTGDVPAILTALREAGVTRFGTAKELGEICGWSSPSSATAARDALLSAGALREMPGGMFAVISMEAEVNHD
jgi:hypothetical protein